MGMVYERAARIDVIYMMCTRSATQEHRDSRVQRYSAHTADYQPRIEAEVGEPQAVLRG